jgi:hypothetical protein
MFKKNLKLVKFEVNLKEEFDYVNVPLYQVSVHLAKRFQRRDLKKSANQKQELPMAAMFVNGSEQN